MAEKPKGPDRPANDPYAKPANADDAIALVEPLAKNIVKGMLVGKSRIMPEDEDWYLNGARIVVWHTFDKYNPDRISQRTGKRCTFEGYMNWVLCVWAGHVLRERIAKHDDKLLSLDANPETFEKLDADAIKAFMLQTTTSDMDELIARLDLEGAIEELPARLRKAARLIYLERVPSTEVPKRLGISKSKYDHDHIPGEIVRRLKASLPGWEPEGQSSCRRRIRRRRS